jgi:hypothetical protein
MVNLRPRWCPYYLSLYYPLAMLEILVFPKPISMEPLPYLMYMSNYNLDAHI